MFRIGIIDDAKGERDDIQVSLLDNAGWDADISFKEYELKARTQEDIINEIREDVENGDLHALIVDFKLDTAADIIQGWEIIEYMHERVPELPETKSMVENILLNMQKYTNHRKELEARLDAELLKLDENRTDPEILESIIQTENELSRYKPIYQTSIDTALKMEDLKDTFELLRKYEELLK